MESQSRTAQSAKVEAIAAKILALRKLSTETGFHTTRTQNAILASLSTDELCAVAQIITGVSRE